MTREEMLKRYEELSVADRYNIGFVFQGDIYSVEADTLDPVMDCIKLGRMASKRGGHAKLRLMFDKVAKLRLIASGRAVKIGVEAQMKYADKYNNGEHYEHFIYDLHGEHWEKDRTPFYVDGDITVNGLKIQIKFDQAELTNELTLSRVRA
jgi:hypothetical protein